MIKVFAIHTALAMVEPTTLLFKERLPEVKLNHIVDDSLIQEVIASNGVTKAVHKRLLSHYFAAVDAGADIIYNICSSVGDVAENARAIVPIPLIKIDDAMALKAIEISSNIAVLATLPTTLGPTCRLVQKQADLQGKEINLIEGLADGAFQAMMDGDRDTHDRLILEASVKVAARADVIVLAQASMGRMQEQLESLTGKIILSSPVLGIEGLRKFIADNY